MPRIVIFDELATPQRVTKVTGISENEGPYLASGRTDFLVSPDLSALEGIVPRQYWKHAGGLIVSYGAAEIAAQDAAEATQKDLATREAAKDEFIGFSGSPLVMRAFASVLVDEFNSLRRWLDSFQAQVNAASSLPDLKARIALLPPSPDRTLAQVRNAIEARVDGGTVDS
jgi:hypothetical protein